MKSRAWWQLALLCAISLISTTFAATTHADPKKFCVPSALGVPGRSGPPEWASGSAVDHKIDDPRWVGATSQAYPLAGSSAQSQVRALVHGNTLYLSFQVFVDANATGGEDSVYVALAKNDTSPGKLVRVKITTTTDGEAQGSAAYTSEYYTSTNATSAWTAHAPDAGYAAMTQDLAIWRSNGGDNWAVNLKINLADAALALTSPFKMWTGTVVQEVSSPVPMFVTYAWPNGTAGAVAASGTTPPPSTPNAIASGDWGDVSLGSAGCSTGVSLAWNQIGVKSGSSLTHEISTIHNNTFAAWPTYAGVSTGAGKIQAQFRIANWGSAAEWTPLFTAPIDSDASGKIEQECQQGAGPLPSCPTLAASQSSHQCMLVTLTSSQSVTFLNDSVYRNMDFVNASYFERDAEISIKGLKPLKDSKGLRDVYLFVKTSNMPKETREPLDEKKLMAALDQANARLVPLPPPGRLRAGQPQVAPKTPITSSKTPHEALVSAWPTYEVHVFYDTGEKRGLGKELMTRLQPGMPFGFYAYHRGSLQGWLHEMVGLNAQLQQVAPNFFKVVIPDNGSIKLTNRLEAREPGKKAIIGSVPEQPQVAPLDCTKCPKPPSPQPRPEAVPPVEKASHCNCSLPGNPGVSKHALWLGALAFGLFVVRRRRRTT
ncbi:MAG TPA: MYXO-CTERM sorting domain-containing protein [Polyangiaceae bacterium]|nr:MYXO-CTERM sorting domain-containing protein [Polyangiaceae bacterium]